jgi:serine/threonine protein kinase/Flp pilus assembly protein TadD
MTSEQWQKVKGLFDAALALAPGKREKFIKNACAGDEALRREVENLLASFDDAEGFMEKPAAAEVASLIIDEHTSLRSGERIAHYEIVSQIGEGGMGEVYLAKDTRLNRNVALKILPQNLTADQSRLARFKQEAQAASALNHPNIITIYEIREYDGTHLIATEFVEGETLREKVSRENSELNEILDIAVQVASALSVAHSAGVVHRDIKPENIMCRPDGIVKLLDFGLAKLARSDEAKPLDVSTQKLTNPGMVIGTVNYMSPEQARGAQVDRRTDIWSLGVCLYEMLARELPFSGKTINHTLVAIMEQKPLPLLKTNPAVSAELERIVAKLLEKEPGNRYQTATELLADLHELQRNAAAKSSLSETTRPAPSKMATDEIGQTVSSIAVLPFLTLGLTREEEYLGVGLADALITQLSQTQKLSVRPTSAVRSFTDAGRDALKIGKKLTVGAVLEGNLQKAGERLRVTVQLINVGRGETLWADKFNVRYTDFFEVQDQIAEQVTRALLLQLNTSEQTQINKRFTENNAAYLEYLKGRHFWEKRDIESLHRAVGHFRKAIDLDPTFALAFVGLSDAYCMLGVWAEFPQDEIFPRAKAAALRALGIDEKLADAHASLGRIYSVYEWKWAAAENAYLTAIRLNPSCMNAHSWLAKVYVLKHRFDEAIEESRVAQTLDPLSPQPETSLCAAHFYARRYRQAVENYRKVLRMHPDFVPALFGLGMSLAEIGEFDEAIEMQKMAVGLAKNHPLIEAYLAKTFAYSENREKALEYLEKFKSLKVGLLDYHIAAIYARLDEKEKAFEYLESAFAASDRELSGLSIEPEFDNLRGEPRFDEMLRRIGLPEAVKSSDARRLN